jgi:cytochrome c peroxidase
LAERGAAVFATTCAGCHAFGSLQVGQPMRMERLGTDRERLASWSQAVADAFQALDLYSWRYTHFRDSFGYVAVALDGIWARAPYLHNGSVPSLRYLLEPPARRPVIFHRGYNVYAPEDVGFVSSGPEAEKVGRAFDTRLRGNGNGGHDFGTDLPDEDKSALLEYLKTL